MKNFAPILIFTYNRLSSLKRLINSLKNNKEFFNHELLIYSDGPKNLKDKKQVNKVRAYLRNLKGFKKIKIFNNKKNLGMATNIIRGVTKTINKKKRAIVLEDDLVLSKHFLEYMNKSLDKYKKNKKIWHVSGFNFNIKIVSQDTQFFTRVANCWGWATWHDRWKHFKKNPREIINNWDEKKIKKFNFDNTYNFYSQIQRNYNHTLNSWAIFWYATIFNKKGLCINPIKSLTKNIGVGNSATNTHRIEKILHSKINNQKKEIIFPKKIKENEKIFSVLKECFRSHNNQNKLKNFFSLFLK